MSVPDKTGQTGASGVPDKPARPGEGDIVRLGMFGTKDSSDTSGYGRLVVRKPPRKESLPPYGGYFDEVAGKLPKGAVERVVVDRDEITFHVRRESLVEVMRHLRNEQRFELSLGVSGVHYPDEPGEELRAVYHLCSITHNRRIRVEVSAPDSDRHIPSTVSVYPTNDWHERETFDFFGIIFDGHPALTRIEMPDDWEGHPQRKDYPLGGIPVEYRGAEIAAPDQRRSYS